MHGLWEETFPFIYSFLLHLSQTNESLLEFPAVTLGQVSSVKELLPIKKKSKCVYTASETAFITSECLQFSILFVLLYIYFRKCAHNYRMFK